MIVFSAGTILFVEFQGKELESDKIIFKSKVSTHILNSEKIKNKIKDVVESPNSGELKNSSHEAPEKMQKKLISSDHGFHTTLIQIIIILTLAGIFGYLFRLIGQPSVIGEILGGILLGPSFLGWISPSLFEVLFPVSSFPTLELLSQLGLCLFMFIIGMEIDLTLFRRSAQSALVISHSAILIPFMLGVLSAIWIYPSHSPEGISFLSFSLFIGIAMSITAFPVLARIVQERGLTKTHLGTMAITSAAINDITAWPVLTLIVAIANSSSLEHALYTFLYSIVFILSMIYVVKPLLKRAGRVYVSKENLTKGATTIIFLIILISSLTTESIGIHALFGSFLVGAIMPKESNLKKLFVEKIEDFSMVLLLPLFFAYTGLRTNIGLLSGDLISIFFLILGLAIAGKIGGSAIAALITGETLKNSISIGVLMNTRGLMELIVLNIGYDLGILSEDIFTIMVAVALLTTVLTGPLLSVIQRLFKEHDGHVRIQHKMKNILLSFADPLMGVKLLNMIYAITPKVNKDTSFTALHITPYFSINKNETTTFRNRSFENINKASQKLNVELKNLHRVTDHVTAEIIKQTIYLNSDLLLLGAARSFFSNNLLGGKIKKILDYSTCNTGVLIDSGFNEVKDILILTEESEIERFSAFMVTLNHEWRKQKNMLTLFIGNLEKTGIGKEKNQNKFDTIDESSLNLDFFGNYDLVICTLETWRRFENIFSNSRSTSFLVLQIK
ncbi:MAG: cation:proton antiporter [Spirochaetia bacterium]|nr:cation:proton antiporter [Spirochaetia bacterium]